MQGLRNCLDHMLNLAGQFCIQNILRLINRGKDLAIAQLLEVLMEMMPLYIMLGLMEKSLLKELCFLIEFSIRMDGLLSIMMDLQLKTTLQRHDKNILLFSFNLIKNFTFNVSVFHINYLFFQLSIVNFILF